MNIEQYIWDDANSDNSLGSVGMPFLRNAGLKVSQILHSLLMMGRRNR